MCVIYFPRQMFFYMQRPRFGCRGELHPSHTEMVAQIMNGDGLDVEVNSCGYRWVYEEDLQQILG